MALTRVLALLILQCSLLVALVSGWKTLQGVFLILLPFILLIMFPIVLVCSLQFEPCFNELHVISNIHFDIYVSSVIAIIIVM